MLFTWPRRGVESYSMLPEVNHAEYGEDEEQHPGSNEKDQLSQDQKQLRSGRSVFTEERCELPPRQGRKAITDPPEE